MDLQRLGLVDSPWAWAGGAALFVAYFALRETWSWYRLSHVPGPFWAGWSMYPMLKRAHTGRYHEEMIKLWREYGPVVRVGPNKVLVSDAEAFRRISAVRSPYTKGRFYDFGRLVPGKDNLFSMRDEEQRRELRAKLSHGYSGRETKGFEPAVDRHIAGLIDLLERKYSSTATEYRPVDLAQKIQYLTLDAVCEVGFGKAPGYLASDKDLYDHVKTNNSLFPVLILLSHFPWIAKAMHRWPMKDSLPKVGDKAGFGALMGFAQNLVDERLQAEKKDGLDMMASHIRHGMTRDELIQEVFLEMVAGTGTTASAISLTLLCLLTDPAAFATLKCEVDDRARESFSGVVSSTTVQDMPYLQAVVREGLRLYPPSVGTQDKLTPPEGDVIHGVKLPGSVDVGQNLGGVLRDAQLFGPDVDVFRPGRWLEATVDDKGDGGERCKRMHAAVDLVFGYGRYQCLGKGIVWTIVPKVIFELVRTYDIAIVNKDKPMKLVSAAFWVVTDFWLQLSKRA